MGSSLSSATATANKMITTKSNGAEDGAGGSPLPESNHVKDVLAVSDNESDEQQSTADVVRGHVYGSNAASLATISANEALAGFPFGSVVPYALDEEGRPLIMITDIAEHTRNLKADNRASLLIRPDGHGDPQNRWRVTLVGRIEPIKRTDDALQLKQAMARYVAQVPAARGYNKAHAFELWRMEIERVRYIGGFGRIHWVEAADYLRPRGHSGFEKAASGIISHMNEDHADALIEYCCGLRGVTPQSATLHSVEAGGFFVATTSDGADEMFFFPFDTEITAVGARHAFVDLLKKARAS